MKNTLATFKSLILASILLVGVGFASAQIAAPASPSSGNPPVPLNVGTIEQYKEGPLAIGQSALPQTGAVLEVGGQMKVTGELGVTTSGVILGNTAVGSGTAANNAMEVTGQARSTHLNGGGRVCATATGILIICPTPGNTGTPYNPGPLFPGMPINPGGGGTGSPGTPNSG